MAYSFGATWLKTLLADIQTALGTEWEIQGGSDSGEQAEAAQARDRRGDVLFVVTTAQETLYNKRTEFTANFVCNVEEQAAGSTIKLGGVGYGTLDADKIVVTQVSASQQGGEGARRATLSLTLHKHTGQTSTVKHGAAEYTITLPKCGFGIVEALGVNGTIPENLTSHTFTAAIKHTDVLDEAGAFLCGDSADCRIDVTADSEDSGTALAAATGWAKTGAPANASNTAYKTIGLAVHKFQAPD